MRVSRLYTVAAIVGTTFALASTGTASAAQSCPWMNTSQSPATRATELLNAMAIGDKIQMVTGSYAGPNAPSTPGEVGAAGTIEANPSLCIPALVLADNGNGVGDQEQGTTAFPDSIALTAAWDPALAESYGQVLGTEAFDKGVNVLLGPGMDIARNPLNGRNFEYAGEDPYLAGQASAAMIRGVQSEHVIATAKHYALNDQEIDGDGAGNDATGTSSSDASQRTMQEIDLPAFDAAVQAGAGAVMCAYNRINSVYSCENPYTLQNVLDGQFGFSGFVMSDWGATHSTVASADAGLDMEMPSATYYGSTLETAVQDGQVSMATLNGMVYRILYTMFRVGLFDHQPQEGAAAAATVATSPADLAMATKVGEAGTVLLKNQSGVLPLNGSGKTIAVIGPAAGPAGAEACYQGGGSGHNPEFGYLPAVSPLTAIQTRAAQAGDVVTYADGDVTQDAVAAASTADYAVVFICDAESEGADRPDMNADFGQCEFVIGCTYDTALDQNSLVSAVAAANPHTIVVIQAGSPVTMPWINQVAGVLDNWYPGQTDGDTIAPILFGDYDPSGHLPDTFPVNLSDGPLKTAAQYPGVMEPGDTVGPHSTYSEGLEVGYRWYDEQGIKPLFPFGYGLSYTTFSYTNLKVTPEGNAAEVSFTLTNTGSRYGADVAQVYVGDPSSTGEPPRQLKGFQKVSLAPGQSQTVSINLVPSSFAYWSESDNTWMIAPGKYQIWVGDSSALANLPLETTLNRGAAKLSPSVY